MQQFPGFLVCLVNTVVTFSIYKNAHPSNFKRPVGRGIERESHMLEYISTHAHYTFFSQRKNSGAIQGHHGPLVCEDDMQIVCVNAACGAIRHVCDKALVLDLLHHKPKAY